MSTEDAKGRARLASKIAAVMGEVKRVRKDGYNAHHKYAFASAGEVVDMVRGLLADKGVALLQLPTDVRWDEIKTRNGTSTVCRAWFAMTLVCADTGAQFVVPWLGEAQDSMDKGYSKAATAAQKYFLLKTFLISTGDEEDPDQGQAPQPAPQPRATPQQIAEMKRIVSEMGGEWEAYADWAASKTGGIMPEDLDQQSAADWITELKRKQAARAAASTESDTDRVKRRAKKNSKKREESESARPGLREPGEEG